MKKFLIIIFVFMAAAVVFAVLTVLTVFWIVYLPVDQKDSSEIEFVITKGEGVIEISRNLKNQGIIKSDIFFQGYSWLKGAEKDLKAGRYIFTKSMNIPDVVEKLAKGKTDNKKITIIEGWNLRDIGEYFEREGLFSKEEFYQITGFPLFGHKEDLKNNFEKSFEFLKEKPKEISLEGYLFPDTYEIFPNETIEEIIQRMINNFDQKLSRELKNSIKDQEKTIFDIITMASLIEKEVKTLEDKKIVSGILWKRIESGMPLQTDAAISYITGKKTVKISFEETRIDSPYNTYLYQGLPLGPISNPGLESIIAALNPEKSDYWYYLSAPSGETIFSRTFDEHRIAKEKYLR